MRMLTKDIFINLNVTNITADGMLIVQCSVAGYDVRETLDGTELMANVRFKVPLKILDKDKVREALLDDDSDKIALLPIIFFKEDLIDPVFLQDILQDDGEKHE